MISGAIKSVIRARERRPFGHWRWSPRAGRWKRIRRDQCTRCFEHYDNCACDTVASSRFRARKEEP